MMTLTQMRYFYEVCQWQNITKAAEHLHVSQPTISVAMQTLEAETGLNLFHREGRKLVVTPESSKLLVKVNHILSQMDQLRLEIPGHGAQPQSHPHGVAAADRHALPAAHPRRVSSHASADQARDHRVGRHQRSADGRGRETRHRPDELHDRLQPEAPLPETLRLRMLFRYVPVPSDGQAQGRLVRRSCR